MIIDSPIKISQIEGLKDLTVVVGSGAVGLYFSILLSRMGKKVLVVESGGENLGNFSKNSYKCIGNKHEGIEIGRSRTFGGTTNLWGGQLVEFQNIDFESRSWVLGSDWPIKYSEIQPYYRTTYDNLGINVNYLNDSSVWSSIGLKEPTLGLGLEIFLSRWLKIPNLAQFFRREINESRDLIVLLNHTAVDIDGSGKRVTKIKVLDEKLNASYIEGRQFVLAAGTIENIRLMLKGCLSKNWGVPWRDNPYLGRCFQDHIGGKIAEIKPLSKSFFDFFSTIYVHKQKYQPKLRFQEHFQIKSKLLNAQAMMVFESSIGENLNFLKQFLKAAIFSRKISSIKDMVSHLYGCMKYLLPIIIRFIKDHRVFVPANSRISLVIQSEQIPNLESRVTIDPKDLDQFELPRVILDWRVNLAELKTIREFAIATKNSLECLGLSKVKIPEALLSLDPKFFMQLRDTNHQSGGLRMGRDSNDGVVDRDLRVFGTDNLFILGASTFRTISNANITFTAIAFASRLVDLLKDKNADN